MCGIAGFVGKGDRETLIKMLDAISHRGLDDRGILINGKIGLGHNRLSIIDLSTKGKQPMFDNLKSVYIILNGEIYNFQELKNQLKPKYRFRSETDTEVLLYAYKEWGIDCLKKINGMFSFVIYDKAKELLFGARDRLGEKPLKYYLDENIFAFASEVKGLLPILKAKPEIDPIAINHYLTLQYIPSPLTGFKKIFKLPPAHYFIFKNGKLQINKYWDISFKDKLALSEQEWEEVLWEKLKEIVKLRLVADVPIGVFLSGGIDSSIVVALMSEVFGKRVKTFNIGFNDSDFDESKYANLVAKLYETDHTTFQVTSKIMQQMFIRLFEFYDEPFADNSAIPTLLLSQLTSKHVKVALSGDGGDENFAGYERYNIVYFSQYYKRAPKSLRGLFLRRLTNIALKFNSGKLLERADTYATTFDLPFYRKYLYYSCFFTSEEKERLYSKDFNKRLGKSSDTFSLFKSYYDLKLSDLDNALNFDLKNYLPEDLMYKIDIASMAFSLEVRAPFLDYQLVELTARMPDTFKVKFFNKKYILKKLLAKKGLLPKNIIYREKKGFVTPIGEWLRENYKDYVYDLMTSSKLREANIFDDLKIDKYLKDYFLKKHNKHNNVFALLALASWINKYF